MPITTIDGHQIHVDDEGFLTDHDEWTEDLGQALAAQIGIELTDEHWKAIRFLREDFADQGETADAAPGQRVGRHPDQGAVRALPAEAGQEDGLHRRAAQAARLRVTPTTHEETRHDHHRHRPAIVPSFDDDEQPAASSRSSAPRATSTWPTPA